MVRTEFELVVFERFKEQSKDSPWLAGDDSVEPNPNNLNRDRKSSIPHQ